MNRETVRQLAEELLDTLLCGREKVSLFFGLSTKGNPAARALSESLYAEMLAGGETSDPLGYWHLMREGAFSVFGKKDALYEFSAFLGSRQCKTGESLVRKSLVVKYFENKADADARLNVIIPWRAGPQLQRAA